MKQSQRFSLPPLRFQKIVAKREKDPENIEYAGLIPIHNKSSALHSNGTIEVNALKEILDTAIEDGSNSNPNMNEEAANLKKHIKQQSGYSLGKITLLDKES